MMSILGNPTDDQRSTIRYSATVLTNVVRHKSPFIATTIWPKFLPNFIWLLLVTMYGDNFRGSSLSSSLVSPSHPLINYVRLWNGHPDLFRNCWFGIMVSKIWLKSVHERAHSHSSIKEFMMPVDILCSGRFSLLTRVCEIHKNG